MSIYSPQKFTKMKQIFLFVNQIKLKHQPPFEKFVHALMTIKFYFIFFFVYLLVYPFLYAAHRKQYTKIFLYRTFTVGKKDQKDSYYMTAPYFSPEFSKRGLLCKP